VKLSEPSASLAKMVRLAQLNCTTSSTPCVFSLRVVRVIYLLFITKYLSRAGTALACGTCCRDMKKKYGVAPMPTTLVPIGGANGDQRRV
jgi:hypothetical protein